MQRPDSSEHAAFYATYTDIVPDGDVIETLAAAPPILESLLQGLTAAQERFAYGPDKWTIREVLGHVIDAERMFAYRALHFARGESTALPGMDQDDWAATSPAGDRDLADLLAEFRALREANVRCFAAMDETALARCGVASDVPVSVRALVFIVCGHELHHRRILQERYLAAL